jgi:hypothetical protein
LIFFEREKTLEILGNSRPGGNGGGDHDGGVSLADGGHAGALGSDSRVRVDGVHSSGAMATPRVKRVYKWFCQWCQIEFETTNYSQRYCKASHKVRAAESRRAQREKIPIDAEIP